MTKAQSLTAITVFLLRPCLYELFPISHLSVAGKLSQVYSTVGVPLTLLTLAPGCPDSLVESFLDCSRLGHCPSSLPSFPPDQIHITVYRLFQCFLAPSLFLSLVYLQDAPYK